MCDDVGRSFAFGGIRVVEIVFIVFKVGDGAYGTRVNEIINKIYKKDEEED